MSEAIDLSVVLPSYMEEENLRLLLPRLKTTLASLPLKSEILIIDTIHPLDATQDACNSNSVRYLNRSPSNSFGDAVRTGIKEARGTKIIFMDADGSHNPEFLPNLVRHKDDYDVVIASRYVDGGFTENSPSLIWMSRVLNITYSIILKLKMKDVSNSYKLYDTAALKALSLRCNNFDIVEELLYKLARDKQDFTFKEVPFSFKKRMFGETKRNLIKFILTYFITIIRLRFLG